MPNFNPIFIEKVISFLNKKFFNIQNLNIESDEDFEEDQENIAKEFNQNYIQKNIPDDHDEFIHF